MTEIIERAVAAMKESVEHSPYNFGEDGIRAVYRDAVVAVIGALRQPTEAMLDAACETGQHENGLFVILPSSYDAPWRAMIDAALGKDKQ